MTFRKPWWSAAILLCAPSQYALQCLKNFEYLELWYLTQEGFTDAAQHQHMQNDDSFGLTKVNDVVALRQVSAFRDSRTPEGRVRCLIRIQRKFEKSPKENLGKFGKSLNQIFG